MAMFILKKNLLATLALLLFTSTTSQAIHAFQNMASASILIALTLANDSEGKTLSEQLEPSTLAKNFTEVYWTAFVTTLSHELGHALAAYLLNDAPLNVHMGALPQNQLTPYLFKAGPITVDSINPLFGYCRTGQSNSDLKRFIVLAAGPLGGIIGYYLLKAFKTFLRSYSENQPPKTLLSQCTASTPLDALALGHLLYLIVPLGSNGDASKMLKLCGADVNTVDSIGQTAGPLIIYGLPMIFVLKKLAKESLFFKSYENAQNLV